MCSIPSGYNSSFITLIDKVSNPIDIKDFRPITLTGIQYKFISKLLALKLTKFVALVVSMEHFAFVKGRHVLDGPLVVNEIIDWFKKKKKELMIFKISFRKAYNYLSWDYLIKIMNFMGFSQIWCNLIRRCLRSVKSSVLMNGNPIENFDIKLGLRHGNPLSRFLFNQAI